MREFVFVHIPKNAGTSVLKWLCEIHAVDDYCLSYFKDPRNRNPFAGPPFLNHLTANEILKHRYVSKEKWDRAFKFCIVRNPWDRMVSEYSWRRPSLLARKSRLPWNFRTFVSYWRHTLVDSHLKGRDGRRHLLAQHRFVLDRKGKMLVDYVCRYENLVPDLQYVFKQIGLPSPDQIFQENRSPRKHSNYRDFYDDDLKNQVKRLYRKDIDYFGYQF